MVIQVNTQWPWGVAAIDLSLKGWQSKALRPTIAPPSITRIPMTQSKTIKMLVYEMALDPSAWQSDFVAERWFAIGRSFFFSPETE